jgi:hypothetical protein
VSIIRRWKANQKVKPCMVCGEKNQSRIEIRLQDGRETRRFSLCCQIPAERAIWEEVRRERLKEGKSPRFAGKSYDEVFRQCWKKVFGEMGIPLAIGICKKRDSELTCYVCGVKMGGERGIWISPIMSRGDVVSKRAVCLKCIMGDSEV